MDGADAQTMAAVRSVCSLQITVSIPGLHIGFKHIEISTSSCDDLETSGTAKGKRELQRKRKGYYWKAS